MRYVKSAVGMLSISMLWSGAAVAQWSFGGAVINADPNYRGLDSETLVVPMVGYEGERFYFRGIEAGYRIYQSKTQRFTAHLTGSPFRFRPGENNDPQLAMLDRRDFSAEAALSFRQQSMYGAVSVRAGLDVRGNGHRLSGSYSFPLSEQPQRWQFGPEVGVTFISSRYTDYYYGVSATESARSGLPAYSSQDAFNPFFSLGGYYRFAERWTVLANYRHTRISSKIANSPMTNGDSASTFFMAIAYSF